MNEAEFKIRTKQFALRVIRMGEALPRGRTGDVLARQILKSGTSVAANYRSACRGRSAADVLARLGTVEEEADETLFWLEMIAESGLIKANRLAWLMDECNQLIAMTVASIKTLRRRESASPRGPKSKIQNPKSHG